MWEIKAEVQKSFWEVSVFVCFSSFFLLGEREKERKVEWGEGEHDQNTFYGNFFQ